MIERVDLGLTGSSITLKCTKNTERIAYKIWIECVTRVVGYKIDLEKDCNSIVSAINCGVTVVATIHANDIVHLKNKKGFDEIIVLNNYQEENYYE